MWEFDWIKQADAEFKKRMLELQPATRIFNELKQEQDKNRYGQE